MLQSTSSLLFSSLRQHVMKGTVPLLIWFLCTVLQTSVTCFTIPERLDRYTIITARNKSVDADVPSGSNSTLLITAPIAAGIFLTVIMFFYCILFKDLTKKTGSEVSVENYERLPNVPDFDAQPPSTSTSTQAAATNYGYVPGPGGEPGASSSSSGYQTTTVSVEPVN